MRLKNLIYIAATSATLIGGLSSCKKSLFDINKNPNQATDSTVSYDVILPAALNTTGAVVGTSFGFLQNWLGYWARSGTYAPNVTEETYQITTTFGNGIWNGLYDNAYDYQIMQIKAAKAGATFYEGIARIMKAHNFQMLVDVYGNVPYFGALKGNANTTPQYDAGAEIYADLLKQIDTAIVSIAEATNTANKGIRENDIMFGTNLWAQGSLTNDQYLEAQKMRWMKFANTLKLRLLIHLMNGGVNTPEQIAAIPGVSLAAEFTKMTALEYPAGSGTKVGFMGSGLNAEVNPGYKSDKPNPFFTTFKTTTTGAQAANNVYYRANKWGIEYYIYNGDPRRTRFYEAGSNGLTGVEYGLPPVTENASSNLAGIGPGLYKSSTAAQTIMTAAESFMLQAEARIRGHLTTGATASSLLTSGITESFTYVGATGAASYISGNAGYADVDINAAPLGPNLPGGGLFTIISQKWFALNGFNTLEVWTDYRRVNMKNTAGVDVGHFIYGEAVGYDPGPPISVSPQLPPSVTQIPIRLLYPQAEYNYNPANVGAQGSINQFTSRVFWDLN
jgi:hypothetical protein